jgi:pyrroloquinoline-quinone synthase
MRQAGGQLPRTVPLIAAPRFGGLRIHVYNYISDSERKFMNQYLDKIDNDISGKHLLKHPFYLAWTRGELSREALIDYARQYYHHVAAFPTYLSAVHAKCDDQATRKQLLSNLIDEEAGSPNHPELWKQFAKSLGVDDVDLAMTEKQPETKNLIDTFRAICSEGSTAEGLAALYAYESQIPAICESKIDGLKNRYGFNDPKHYEYFSVHIEADREHSAAERKMLGAYIDNNNFESVKESVNRVLNALWQMLSGVCHRHAIAC